MEDVEAAAANPLVVGAEETGAAVSAEVVGGADVGGLGGGGKLGRGRERQLWQVPVRSHADTTNTLRPPITSTAAL